VFERNTTTKQEQTIRKKKKNGETLFLVVKIETADNPLKKSYSHSQAIHVASLPYSLPSEQAPDDSGESSNQPQELSRR
jgi:hypothetical protein